MFQPLRPGMSYNLRLKENYSRDFGRIEKVSNFKKTLPYHIFIVVSSESNNMSKMSKVKWVPECSARPCFHLKVLSKRLQSSELLSKWIIFRAHELWSVLQDLFYRCKPCCNGCIWMVSPRCASSSVCANQKKQCKHSCTGYIWTAFLLCASSLRELSIEKL